MKQITIGIVGKFLTVNVKTLLNKNFKVIIFKDKFNTQKDIIHSNLQIINLDFSDLSTLQDQLNKYEFSKPVALMSLYENYVVAKAKLLEIFNITGISIKSAKIATDKELMRQAFEKNFQEINPKFLKISNLNQAIIFANKYQYPVILKPANLSKSLLIITCKNEKELITNFNNINNNIKNIYQKYQVKHLPKIIIEQCLIGSFHSIDLITNSKGEVFPVKEPVDLIFGKDLGLNDNFNYSRTLPSKLTDENKHDLLQAAEKAALSLNLKNSPAHVELVLTKDGAKVIEIGARYGGYRNRMYKLALGIDIFKAEINAYLNNKITLKPIKNDACIVIELFPENPGKLKNITNINKLKKLKSFFYFSQKKKIEEHVDLSKNGDKMTAVVILSSKNKKEINRDYDWVKSNVKVLTND